MTKMRYLIKWITGKRNKVKIGGKTIQVKPLNAKGVLHLLLLVAPYLQDILPSLMTAKALTEPGLFRATMKEVTYSMEEKGFPIDIVKLFSIFLGVDEKWLTEVLQPHEMMEAFEIIGRLNKLDDIVRMGLSIGMITMADIGWMQGISDDKEDTGRA